MTVSSIDTEECQAKQPTQQNDGTDSPPRHVLSDSAPSHYTSLTVCGFKHIPVRVSRVTSPSVTSPSSVGVGASAEDSGGVCGDGAPQRVIGHEGGGGQPQVGHRRGQPPCVQNHSHVGVSSSGVHALGFGVSDLGVWGLGFRVQGSECGV